MKLYITTLLLICLPAFCNAQTVDTIKNAIAYRNDFTLLNFGGLTAEKHIWFAGLNNRYDEKGASKPIEMVRIDVNTNAVSYKIIPGTTSAANILWTSTFDSLGNFYLGFNSNRKIFKFNYKNAIDYQNLGIGFLKGSPLAYSIALGTDKHVYFGGSSGDTYWSEYDPYKNILKTHPPIDLENDYVLSIMGDKDWIYAQTGQRKSINIWAVRKSDDYKIKLFSIPNNLRFNTGVVRDGVIISFYTDTLSGSYILKNGRAIPGTLKSMRVDYNELDNASYHPEIVKYFDKAASDIVYSINKSPYKKIHINTSETRTNIRDIFFDKTNNNGFGYIGEYYGNWYWYNTTTNTSQILGNEGVNIYSQLQYSDSIFYFGGYPSGALLKWNKTKPWTLQKFINGKIITPDDAMANPKIVGYFKSNTPAGFHHLEKLIIDAHGNLVGAGDVIRIGNSCSIGCYNVKNGTMQGYDFHKISGLAFEDIANYKDKVIMSTNNFYGGNAKLYFYDPEKNIMTDSLSLGFKSYGKIYIRNDELIGISPNMIYKIDLKTNKLIEKIDLPKPVTFSMQLSDGYIAINTASDLPKNFSTFIKVPYNNGFEAPNGILYTVVNGNTIIRIKNLVK